MKIIILLMAVLFLSGCSSVTEAAEIVTEEVEINIVDNTQEDYEIKPTEAVQNLIGIGIYYEDILPMDCEYALTKDGTVLYKDKELVRKELVSCSQDRQDYQGITDIEEFVLKWGKVDSFDVVTELETDKEYTHIYKCIKNGTNPVEYYILFKEAHDLFPIEVITYEVLDNTQTDIIEEYVKSMNIRQKIDEIEVCSES